MEWVPSNKSLCLSEVWIDVAMDTIQSFFQPISDSDFYYRESWLAKYNQLSLRCGQKHRIDYSVLQHSSDFNKIRITMIHSTSWPELTYGTFAMNTLEKLHPQTSNFYYMSR